MMSLVISCVALVLASSPALEPFSGEEFRRPSSPSSPSFPSSPSSPDPGIVDPCLDQVNRDGFGNHNNRYAWSMKTFGDHLYVGVLNTTLGLPLENPPWEWGDEGRAMAFELLGLLPPALSGALPDPPEWPELPDLAPFVSEGSEIWRFDGARWEQVMDTGWGDVGNVGVRNLWVHDKALYAGTMNFDSGCELWRTRNGTDWRQVGSDGFRNPLNTSVRGMATWRGRLYVGTTNLLGGEVWSTDGLVMIPSSVLGFGDPSNWTVSTLQTHGGALYAGTWNRNGCQLWRNGGIRWRQVVGPDAATPAGFGDSNTVGVMSMAEFGGALYVGTVNFVTGFTMWRTFDGGATWEQVGRSGFGDPRAKYAWDLEVHDGALYTGTFVAGLVVPFRHGAQLYRTTDGDRWVREVGPLGTLSPPGFFDFSNYGFRTLEPYAGDLYIGTAQCFFCPFPVTGTEVWRRSADCGG